MIYTIAELLLRKRIEEERRNKEYLIKQKRMLRYKLGIVMEFIKFAVGELIHPAPVPIRYESYGWVDEHSSGTYIQSAYKIVGENGEILKDVKGGDYKYN